MYSIDINPNDPKSIDAALRTEWLLTNGIGGYAMGTALGVNTRRYHGLLVAATKPPVGRIVALHSMIEQLIMPRDDGTEEVIDLSTQQFVGGSADGELMMHPDGWRGVTRFEQTVEGIQTTWTDGEIGVQRLVTLVPGRNYGVISYVIIGLQKSAVVRLRPLLPLRDFHSLSANSGPRHVTAIENGCVVDADQFRCGLTCKAWKRADEYRLLRWQSDEQTWIGFAYARDRERGQEWREDVWSAGYFEASLPSAVRHHFAIVIEVRRPSHNQSERVMNGVLDALPPEDDRESGRSRLTWATSAFVVSRKSRESQNTSVIAGYPWFGDWGRDTMIALPGLMLCTGRLDEARSTLLNFARHLRHGLIPNLFDDYGGAAHYNTVDASLWFIHAVHQFLSPSIRVKGEPDDEFISACREIIAAYRRGTDFNIHMDERDGLIVAGDQTTQLTWMDAARDGVVFTPRYGKAVEINALWHNALVAFGEMTDDADERNEMLMLARRVAASLRSEFWWNERQCLHDCLTPAAQREGASDDRAPAYLPDGKLRPNQILAVSLPHSPLNESQQRAVVQIVGERLLTPYGLRTLDRDDPGYRGRYQGNLFERDAAYHNGTVWPWLIGPYCEALLRVESFSDDAKSRVRAIIQPLIDEMSNASGGRCLGQIAEVYDGDQPHCPSGCPAQAWSVAETLRVLHMIDINRDSGPA